MWNPTVEPVEFDGPMFAPANAQAKCEIVNHLWGVNAEPEKFDNGELNFDSYFQYYTYQCNLARTGAGSPFPSKTHQDITAIAKSLSGDMPREVTTQNPASIDLAARLLLMMEIGDLEHGFIGQGELDWNIGTLKEFVHRYFTKPDTPSTEYVKLEKRFNARNLERVAGFNVIWTNNLADHLRMTEDDRVAIFHHATFLKWQKKSVSPGHWWILNLTRIGQCCRTN
jgi:hypothetical protein